MKILYITPYVPSRIRTRPYHLIRALIDQGHEITLVTAATTSAEDQAHARELEAWGIHVNAFPVPRLRSIGNCLRALPTPEPLQAVYAYHPRMEQCVGRLLRKDAFDVTHIEHLRAARLVRAVDGTPIVYDSVDSISLLFEQTIATTPQWQSRLKARLDLGRTRRYEARLLTQVDQVAVTSQRDKEAMERLARRHRYPQTQIAPVTVVTNGVDLDYFRPQDGVPHKDNTIVFTGKMSYHANVAAAMHFVQDVLPHIWRQAPHVRFQIVGKDPPDALRQLARDERIDVTGYVDDIRPYLARAAVSVCPVLYAVGVQNKVLEAMAMGTPVVSYPAGCTAIAAQPGRDILIADDDVAMAQAVLQVLRDPALAQRLSVSGRRYAEERHDWDASARKLVELYARAVEGRHPQAGELA